MNTLTKDRVILHCDMNGFFASVELLSHPELREKPMAVCGDPDSRHGIILAKNEIAKKYGIVTAETIWQAKKKCPDLQLVPPHMADYKYYSQEINKIYQRFTDMVEPFSIDESWLDVTASQSLFGTGRQIADTIRQTIKNELALTLSAGVSFNKVFAKMGSEYKKPDATTEITRQNYKTLLWPLNADELFFVGKATAQKLTGAGILTIGDIACANPQMLKSLLGKSGTQLWEYANGMDQSPVALFSKEEEIKSIGNGTTFKRNLTSTDDILTAVTALSDTVSARLRKHHLKASGIKVDIKDPYFKVISRQKQLFSATNLAEEIRLHAMDIISHCWKTGYPIRLITITGINLVSEDSEEQISLFAEDQSRQEKGLQIAHTMDEVRRKYGAGAIGFAAVIGNDIGVSVRGTNPHETSESETSCSSEDPSRKI